MSEKTTEVRLGIKAVLRVLQCKYRRVAIEEIKGGRKKMFFRDVRDSVTDKVVSADMMRSINERIEEMGYLGKVVPSPTVAGTYNIAIVISND